MAFPKVPPLSAPVAGVFLGAAVGVVDALVVQNGWVRGAEGGPRFSPLLWLAIVWVWMTICGLAGLAVSSEAAGKVRGFALAGAGPGLLLLSRAAPGLQDITRLSVFWTVVLCAAATAALALPIGAIASERTRHRVLWTALLALSLAGMVWSAAGIPLRDLTAPAAVRQADGAKPDVALIFLDTVRFDDALGAGTGVMPNLARFAARSVSFENAWAPAPWTEPVHRTVFTGVEPWADSHGSGRSTLADRFRRRGYATAAFFANSRIATLTKGYEEARHSHTSLVCRSGVGALMRRSPSYGGPAFPLCATMPASEVTSRALRLMRRESRPLFLTLNYMEGHDPYYVRRSCREPGFEPAPRGQRMWVTTARPGQRHPPSQNARDAVHAQYRAALACLDRSLGVLLDELARRPGSIVIIAGDHGEQFGEHGLGAHGNSVYRQVLHVPLVISMPGVQPARVAEPVTLSDLFDTIVEATESRHALPRILDPQRRRPAVSWFRSTSGRAGAVSVSAFSVAGPGLHLIRSSSGAEELYDYRADPAEVSLLGSEAASEERSALLAVAAREARRQRGAAEFNALGYLQ